MPSDGTTEHLCEPNDRSTIAPITMRVADACRFIGISRSTLYVLISRREVEIIKLGNATLVLTESLTRLVERRRIRDAGITD